MLARPVTRVTPVTGVVATGHPLVTDSAAGILRAGGNAFDACVAAGFAAAVAEPGLTSLGGGGFLLARTGAGDATLFDFFVDTPGRDHEAGEREPHFFPITIEFPASTQDFNVGLGSVAVPGTLAGLLHVQRRLGRLPLADVTAPAVRLAREGVPVTPLMEYVLGLLEPIMTLSDDGRRIYAPKGHSLRAGERLQNPGLGDFLESLPDGAERFYRGDLAAAIGDEMAAGDGLLGPSDLAAYAVVERTPLRLRYRDSEILTNPAPSLGGSLIALALDLLADHELAGETHGGPQHAAALAEVMVEVERRRARRPEPPHVTRGTTHASVADDEGNVASMTTSNGEGSGYIAPGSGVMLNNMLGEDDLHPDGFHAAPPGERVASMMSPSIVLRAGEPRLALGSGGSKRIRTALLQVICSVVDFGVPLATAVQAPRLHWDGEALQVEPGWPEAALAAVEARWPVNRWPETNLYFGGVHAVAPPDQAAGDPRRVGAGTRVEA